MTRDIHVFDYAETILKAVQTGVLLTGGEGDQANPMAISWGTLGIKWNKPVFTTFVRTSRHTHDLIEKTKTFTVNIPLDDSQKKTIAYCGAKSGRDVDKITECGLTAVPGQAIPVPGYKELPLTLECRVIYQQDQDQAAISDAIKADFYPPDSKIGNEAFHTMYIGEIVKAYLLE